MKILACNFKNKLTYSEYQAYSQKLEEFSCSFVKTIFIPPFPFLPLFKSKNYELGSQDISSFNETTITGEVTAEALKSLGVAYTLVGHSERRKYKNEINIDFINKINNAWESKIKVIYCIGESLEDHENGNTYMVLEKQISEVLNNVATDNIIIAYEPIWAIGTKVWPDPKEIEETTQFIKDITEEKYDTSLKVLYGGSVDDNNIKELKKIKNVDGFLIGNASLSLDKVKAILLEMMGE